MHAALGSDLPAATTAAAAGQARAPPAAPKSGEPWKVHLRGLSESSIAGGELLGSEPEEDLLAPPGLGAVAREVAERAVAEEEEEEEDDEAQAEAEACEEEQWAALLAAASAAGVPNFMGEYMQQSGQDWWPAQGDMWSSAPSWLQAGDVVCFHGLRQTTALNGVCATVQGWDEASGRWRLKLPNGTEKFAKPENLAVVQAQACAYSGGFGGSMANAGWYWGGAADTKQRSRRGNTKAAAVGALHSYGSDTTAGSSGEDGSGSDKADIPRHAWTTVMMRNIPNDYSGTMLLDLLNEHGFAGRYNLVYLPMDYHRKAGFGYAFIDFVSTEEAQRFRRRFEGFSDWGLVSHKICNVSWSDALQGVQAHIDRYRNSPVMHDAVPDEFKPMLFEHGKRVQFPPPTKSVRAPRLRKKDPRPPAQHGQHARRGAVA